MVCGFIWKNTIGGAILLSTKKPTEEYEGFAGADLGDENRRFFRGGVSGPLLADTLYGGIQLDYRKQDGYRDDPFTGADAGLMWVKVEIEGTQLSIESLISQ